MPLQSPRLAVQELERCMDQLGLQGVQIGSHVNDWNLDRQIVDMVDIPVILAGGLGPDNVAAAIEAVHPDGVDSLTKTSDKENGVLVRKNIEKVREFCRIAHQY